MPTPVYQEYSAPDAPSILSPGPGSGIGGTAIPFMWQSPTLNVDSYRLTVGTTQDGVDLHDSGQIITTTEDVLGIPYDQPTIYVTLYFTNSGQTRFRRYQYVGAHPRIIFPAQGSETPIGNVLLSWTPNDPLSDFNVTITGVETGTVYLNMPNVNVTEAFWRPTVQNIAPADVNFKLTVVWNAAPLTLFHVFKFHTVPAMGIEVDGVTEPAKAFSLAGNIHGSSETLSFPTTINLFRDGSETRFTTSQVPLFSQKFTSSLVGMRQNEFMHYVRENGRKHTWLPAPSHTVEATVMGAILTPSTPFNYMWGMTPYIFIYVAGAAQYLVVKVIEILPNGSASLDMQGFSDTDTGPAKVTACPCFVQIPDFLDVSSAGRYSSAAGVAGMTVALPFEGTGVGSLAYQVNGRSVVPILSPFSSRKFVQLLESTTATHKPEYYPIGKQAVDLSSYTYVWTTPEQLTALVNFFVEMKGAQNSFILTDYMASLEFVSVVSSTKVTLSYASDKYKPSQAHFKYLVLVKGDTPISVHKVNGFQFSQEAMTLILDTPLSAEAQLNLTSCNYSLCEGINARFTDSTLTMSHQEYGKGSAGLSFSEVVE